MIVIDVVQGSDQWLALRANHPTASEAPVMMSASSKMKRNELLHLCATGTEQEVSDWVQRNLFDKGHAYEAAARPIVESMIGEELYPVTATDDDSWLLASFDGITMLEDACFEHKMWNEELAQCVRDQNLPAEYYWQLEQQLFVSKADKVIFVVSDGTPDKFVSMEYFPVPGRAVELIRGWRQFAIDLETFKPIEEKPVAVAEPIKDLPALMVQLVGEVKTSNLAVYKATAIDFIRRIKTDLQTDEDFAQAEATVKFCDNAEKELELVKSQALSQTQTIDELFRTIDQLKDEMRSKRLQLDKLVTARKQSIRLEIKAEAEEKLREHIAAINKELGRVQLPSIVADFATAIKNKRTIASLRDGVDSELARTKIKADATAMVIRENLQSLRELAAGKEFLFVDAQQLVLKPNDDLVNLIKARIAEHNTQEDARIQAAAQKLIDEKAEQEQREREQAEAEALSATPAPVAEPIVAAAPVAAIEPIIAQQAPAAALVAPTAISSAAAPAKAYPAAINRPTDQAIVAAVAKAFSVHLSIATHWLQQMQIQNVA